MTNLDFTYEGVINPPPDHAPTLKTALGSPSTPMLPDAKFLASQIERRFPKEQWAAELLKVPEDRREGAASYLRDRWKILAARERLAKKDGKKSPAGDAALAELAKKFCVES